MFRLITKISIIAILALSIGALVMAVLLFQQRETLKGRTQKLEDAVRKVAATLEKGDPGKGMVTIPEDQLKTFKAKPGGLPAMDVPLSQLVTAAQSQLVRLNNTRQELSDTKITLAKAEQELKDAKIELAAARTKIQEHEATIEAQKNTISEKEDVVIRKLENEKSSLLTKNEAMQGLVDEMETEKTYLTDEIADLEEKVVIYEAKLYPELHKQLISRGQQGTVEYVNPDWNFLVVRLSHEGLKGAAPDMELLVYRGDKLVGKVRLAKVAGDLAVADIINDWQQIPPQNGDGLLY